MAQTMSVTTVPLCDLKAQFRDLEGELRAAIDEVIESQQCISGPQVAQFESAVAAYCGTRRAIGCSSGSDALLLAMMALGIGSGDEVITTPYTFFATAGAISRLGAKPVFVDIEPDGFNLNPDHLPSVVTSRTKAIIPVHLFGQTAEMNPVLDFARERGISVVEDAAQAFGARYEGRAAGGMGTVGCFSFFPSKNLGGMGDGGMVVTDDEELAERLLTLRQHGARTKYYHEFVGGNFRLDTIQAAILLVKLQHVNRWNESRHRLAVRYRNLLEQCELAGVCRCSPELPNRRHVYNQFVVRSPNRDQLARLLKELGIATAVYYPEPLHVQKCFQHLGYHRGDFPESETAARESLALPMFPELSSDQQDSVVQAIRVAVARIVPRQAEEILERLEESAIRG
jgi:dTDP-4-amino-4,6-dideoxygalactose transaminase